MQFIRNEAVYVLKLNSILIHVILRNFQVVYCQHIKYLSPERYIIFLQNIYRNGRWGAIPTFYPTDSFGAVSDSSGKVILVNATLFTDFSDIIIEEQKNGYEQVKYTWKKRSSC